MDSARMLYDRIVAEGREYFNKLKVDEDTESSLLDFKLSDTVGNKLGSADRKNFARALSGFSNGQGGVLVWGVDAPSPKRDEPDVVKGLKEIEKLTNFKGLLEKAIPDLVSPGIEMPLLEPIYTDKDKDTGFLAVYIGKSDGLPVHVRISKEMSDFFIRLGWSFLPMDYSMLADRFGRRPQPRLEVVVWFEKQQDETVVISLGIMNDGRGIARSAGVRLWGFYIPLGMEARPSMLLAPGASDRKSRGQTFCLPDNGTIPPGMFYLLGRSQILPAHLNNLTFPMTFQYLVFADGCSTEGEITVESAYLYKTLWLDKNGVSQPASD